MNWNPIWKRHFSIFSTKVGITVGDKASLDICRQHVKTKQPSFLSGKRWCLLYGLIRWPLTTAWLGSSTTLFFLFPLHLLLLYIHYLIDMDACRFLTSINTVYIVWHKTLWRVESNLDAFRFCAKFLSVVFRKTLKRRHILLSSH